MSKFSRSIWNELHNLTSTEKDLIGRFESAPSGPAFGGAADILRKRGYLDEAIVILEEGLRKYPQYHSARAALGRDYYFKGLMNDARAEFDVVTGRTPDNLMAQRFRLRLAVVLDDKETAQKKLSILKQIGRDDEITQSVRENLSIDDWQGARQVVFAELIKLGIPGSWNESTAEKRTLKNSSESLQKNSEPLAPASAAGVRSGLWEVPFDSQETPPSLKSGSTQISRGHSVPVEPDSLAETLDDSKLPRAFANGETLGNIRGDNDRYLLLRGYKLLPSSGLYARNFADSPRHNALESTTLAEIYATQGMYLKAAEIYEKLTQETPQDAALNKRHQELQSLARDQAAEKPGIKAKTPRLSQSGKSLDAERERKLRVLENLLNKLEGKSPSDSENHSRPRPA